MAIRCANCREAIDLPNNGRLPPWCPRCGINLNKDDSTFPEADLKLPASPVVASGPLTASSPTDSSSGTIANHRQAEGLGDSHALAIHNFSMRGFLQKVSPGIVIVVVFLGIATGMFALAIMRPAQGTTLPGVICVGIAAACIGFMFTVYAKCIRRVEVYADAIRWQRPDGVGRLAWESIAAVYRSEIVMNGFPTSELKLVATNGREVVFDRAVERFFDLAHFVQERCAQLMLPRNREEARNGGADFGPVRVGTVGVTIEGLLIPWESVANYSIANGWLRFQFQEHGSKGIPLHTIPNYLVLLNLMSELAPQVRKDVGSPVTAG
jgi:hypothetical protein